MHELCQSLTNIMLWNVSIMIQCYGPLFAQYSVLAVVVLKGTVAHRQSKLEEGCI